MLFRSEDKQRRTDRIMLAQADIAEASNLRYEGRTLRAIVDGREGDYYVARTEYDSPEVDQVILIPISERRLRRGCFYDVHITGADGYDLDGKVTSPAQQRGR